MNKHTMLIIGNVVEIVLITILGIMVFNNVEPRFLILVSTVYISYCIQNRKLEIFIDDDDME